MFGRKKKLYDDEFIYKLFKDHNEDLFDTVAVLEEILGIERDKADELLQKVLFTKIPLRSIYCIDCKWNIEDAIKCVMEKTGYGYDICKHHLYKMIDDCGLNTYDYRMSIKDDDCYDVKQSNDAPILASCPKCGSTSITTTNKKISVGKGVAGAAVGSLVNPVGTVVGAAVGATHSKKIYNVCMNCGHRWKP